MFQENYYENTMWEKKKHHLKSSISEGYLTLKKIHCEIMTLIVMILFFKCKNELKNVLLYHSR